MVIETFSNSGFSAQGAKGAAQHFLGFVFPTLPVIPMILAAERVRAAMPKSCMALNDIADFEKFVFRYTFDLAINNGCYCAFTDGVLDVFMAVGCITSDRDKQITRAYCPAVNRYASCHPLADCGSVGGFCGFGGTPVYWIKFGGS